VSRSAIVAAAVVCLLATGLAWRGRAAAGPADTTRVSAVDRSAGLTFSPEVAPTDRAWVLAAVAKARPEARRLLDEVDGIVTITTAGAYPGAMGVTMPRDGRYRVWLNIAALDGFRTRDRDVTVLHELGHVVDFALIPAATDATLDEGIPRGGACLQDGSAGGGCTPAEERIADTFAKWALGGAVSAVGAGYAIAMPASLEDWGAPLVQLARSLPD
jgi:hypothetical protein